MIDASLQQVYPHVGSDTKFVVFSTNRPEVIERFLNARVLRTKWGPFTAPMSETQAQVLVASQLPEGMWLSLKGVTLYAPEPSDELAQHNAKHLLTRKCGCNVVYDPSRAYDYRSDPRHHFIARIDEALNIHQVSDACWEATAPTATRVAW